MKLFVFFLFLALPWLPWVGDWALRWTEGNEALQITFALFIFPLAMNAVQYWIIDNFIMDKQRAVEGGEEERQGMMEDDSLTDVDEDEVEAIKDPAQTLKEVDPLPIPSVGTRKGEGSRRSSPKDR